MSHQFAQWERQGSTFCVWFAGLFLWKSIYEKHLRLCLLFLRSSLAFTGKIIVYHAPNFINIYNIVHIQIIIRAKSYHRSLMDQKIPTKRIYIYITIESSARVLEAYANQFQRDFSTFLRLRAEEMIQGGRMVLSFRGRTVENASTYAEFTLLAKTLLDIVIEVCIKFCNTLWKYRTLNNGASLSKRHNFTKYQRTHMMLTQVKCKMDKISNIYKIFV